MTNIIQKQANLNNIIFISEIDYKRFGVRTAKANIVTVEGVDEIIEFCNKENIKFLIARCRTKNLAAVQKMEENGFFLTDTLVHYKRKLKNPFPSRNKSTIIRPFRPNEIGEIINLSQKSFSGYLGHYHADPHLDREDCDDVYVSWTERSCRKRDVADLVLVAVENSEIIGFGTFKTLNEHEGQWVLGGVKPEYQGKGIYREFMIVSFEWGLSKRFEYMFYTTQITNVAVQKVWARLGVELSHSEYTLHKWFS